VTDERGDIAVCNGIADCRVDEVCKEGNARNCQSDSGEGFGLRVLVFRILPRFYLPILKIGVNYLHHA
jgi:hypothetical protein